MADKNVVRQVKADRRRRRVRGKVFGTGARPRLTVAKSLKNIFVQIVDDEKGITLIGLATNSKSVVPELDKKANKTAAAKTVGIKIAQAAKEKGIEQVVFDRNQYRYHGRVKAVADGAREGGLKF
jgi:large subunit ribosomal protein L18